MRLRWWLSGAALGIAAILIGVFVLSGTDTERPPNAPGQRQGPPGHGPLTIVALGDSTVSGEGAGNYDPPTDGANGNWCHRSPAASVHHTNAPGVTEHRNLACSGAPSEQVGLGEATQWTEPSQARRLAELVRDHRVSTVVVGVGANDDPKFAGLISECFQAWVNDRGPPCSDKVKGEWGAKVDAMVGKVADALRDIRKVLASAHYQPDDYQLIVKSYAAPVSLGIPDNLRNLNGCPFRTEDLRWVSQEGVGQLAAGLRDAAEQTQARFLDLSRAGRGHEACSGGPDPSTEWFSRLTVQWADLAHADRARHAIQESFHPNAQGYAQFARCMSEFLDSTEPAAACLAGDDGNLHASAAPPTP